MAVTVLEEIFWWAELRRRLGCTEMGINITYIDTSDKKWQLTEVVTGRVMYVFSGNMLVD